MLGLRRLGLVEEELTGGQRDLKEPHLSISRGHGHPWHVHISGRNRAASGQPDIQCHGATTICRDEDALCNGTV